MRHAPADRRTGGLLAALALLLTSSLVAAVTAPLPATPANTAKLLELVAREHYADAETQARLWLDTSGAHREDKAQRLAGLLVLIDSRVDQALLISANDAQMLDQAESLTADLHGSKARELAYFVALRAMYSLRNDKVAEGQVLLDRALNLLEHGSGRIDPAQRASIEINAAAFDSHAGRWPQAAARLQLAIHALETARDAWSQRTLARLLSRTASYEERAGHVEISLDLSRRSASVAETLAGRNSWMRAIALFENAQTLFFSERYVEARIDASEAVRVLRNVADRPNDLANALSALANVERDLGNLDVSGPLYEEAIALERAHTDDSAMGNLASILNSYATNETRAGRGEHALALYRESLAQKERTFGADSPYLISVLVNIAKLEIKANRTDPAEALLHRAITISDSRFGADSVRGVGIRDGFAELELARAAPAAALVWLEQARKVHEHVYGNVTPPLLWEYCSISLAQARLGKLAEARSAAMHADAVRLDVLEHVLPALNAREGEQLKQRMGSCIGLRLAIATQLHGDSRADLLALWGDIARGRGLVTRLQTLRLAAARTSTDVASQKHWQAWAAAGRAYADALLKGGESAALTTAQTELQRTEQLLGDALPRAGVEVFPSDAMSMALDHLPEAASLAAFVRNERIDLSPDARGEPPLGEEYFALVARGRNHVSVLRVGAADSVDAALDAWNRDVGNPASDSAHLAKTGAQLRTAIWDVLGMDGSEREVFWIPDGVLSRVNPAAFPTASGYLAENGLIVHMLDNETQLLKPASPVQSSELLTVAPFTGAAAASLPVFTRGCRSSEKGALAPLPGAARELDLIEKIWRAGEHNNVTRLQGDGATEAAVAHAATNASVLHFATHAIVFNSDCLDNALAVRGVSLANGDADARAEQASAALVMAPTSRSVSTTSRSQLLTAEQVATWRLDNIDWVVLSACDTGLGPVIVDEGTFGLRRAFRLAGARAVVMSLWSVDDVATAEWMESLYRARVVDHLGASQSTAIAQLATLRARRARGDSTHPFYWAGFIASGY